jgi:hypothetical protein
MPGPLGTLIHECKKSAPEQNRYPYFLQVNKMLVANKPLLLIVCRLFLFYGMRRAKPLKISSTRLYRKVINTLRLPQNGVTEWSVGIILLENIFRRVMIVFVYIECNAVDTILVAVSSWCSSTSASIAK